MAVGRDDNCHKCVFSLLDHRLYTQKSHKSHETLFCFRGIGKQQIIFFLPLITIVVNCDDICPTDFFRFLKLKYFYISIKFSFIVRNKKKISCITS